MDRALAVWDPTEAGKPYGQQPLERHPGSPSSLEGASYRASPEASPPASDSAGSHPPAWMSPSYWEISSKPASPPPLSPEAFFPEVWQRFLGLSPAKPALPPALAWAEPLVEPWLAFWERFFPWLSAFRQPSQPPWMTFWLSSSSLSRPSSPWTSSAWTSSPPAFWPWASLPPGAFQPSLSRQVEGAWPFGFLGWPLPQVFPFQPAWSSQLMPPSLYAPSPFPSALPLGPAWPWSSTASLPGLPISQHSPLPTWSKMFWPQPASSQPSWTQPAWTPPAWMPSSGPRRSSPPSWPWWWPAPK